MRSALFYCFSVILFAACSSTKKATSGGAPAILDAAYQPWSHPPINNTTVPEGGFNLQIIIKNWPNDARPKAIIYHHYQSFTPEIVDTTSAGIVLRARVVSVSSVLQNKSPKVDQSDRLIYETTADSTQFISIDNWNKMRHDD